MILARHANKNNRPVFYLIVESVMKLFIVELMGDIWLTRTDAFLSIISI